MVTIRPYQIADAEALMAVQRLCFPPPFCESLLWTPAQLASHIQHCSEGALCAVSDGMIIGSATAHRIHFDPTHAQHTWAEASADGWLSNHDPHGDTLYGVDIAVAPAWRGHGVAPLLYQARYDLVRRWKLKRFLAGSRLAGLHRHPDLEPEIYADGVVAGRFNDPVITPQLRAGLTAVAVVRGYLHDVDARDCALLMQWQNPEIP